MKLGYIASLNRPGGNLTGALWITSDILGKQLDLLHQMVPQSGVFGYLTDPTFRILREMTSDILAASCALGTELVVAEARSSGEIETAFTTLVQRGTGGLVVSPILLFDTNRDTILELAARNKIPTMHYNVFWVRRGGLMS